MWYGAPNRFWVKHRCCKYKSQVCFLYISQPKTPKYSVSYYGRQRKPANVYIRDAGSKIIFGRFSFKWSDHLSISSNPKSLDKLLGEIRQVGSFSLKYLLKMLFTQLLLLYFERFNYSYPASLYYCVTCPFIYPISVTLCTSKLVYKKIICRCSWARLQGRSSHVRDNSDHET